MAWYTRRAEAQIRALFQHYVRKDRPEAALKLIQTVREAMHAMDEGPPPGRAYPDGWQTLSTFQMRWFKVHRYWFGYSTASGKPVVTNVLYETAEMPKRIARGGTAVPFPDT